MQKPLYAIEIKRTYEHFLSTCPVFILTSRGNNGFCINEPFICPTSLSSLAADSPRAHMVLHSVMVMLRLRFPPRKLVHTLLEEPPGAQPRAKKPKATPGSRSRL